VTGASAGFDLSNAAYDSVSFSVGSQETNPFSLNFNNDGTKMYVIGTAQNKVFQYSLSTAYDLSTASYDSVSFSVSTQESTARTVSFNLDGTKMYVSGNGNKSIFQYTLALAYNLVTASYDSVSFNFSTQDANPLGVAFNNDGTKLYMVGLSTDTVYQYSLSTAFDISTVSYDSVSFSVTSQDTQPFNIAFNSDGSKMYIVGFTNDSIYQYTLSTPFDLSTASYDSVSFSVSSQDTGPAGVLFKPDGTKMYMIGQTNDTIYQYTSSSPITITWDADIEWAGGTAPDSPASGEKDLYTITTDDGGTTYFGVQSGDAFE